MIETLAQVLASTLRSATPLALAGIGGLFSERVGVINIALEGMMLTGAFTAVLISFATGSPWLGLLCAIGAGIFMAAIHAVVSVRFHANQVVSGVALNILGLGMTTFLLVRVWGSAGHSPNVTRIADWHLPFLKNVPFIGTIFGELSPFVYFAALAVWGAHYLLFHTALGLRLLAVGEHPKAADTAGVNVVKMRYVGVLLSGALAGLAGASLSIGFLSSFKDGMTAGRGFIALAAMVFGKWTPLGAAASSLLFGLAEAAQNHLQTAGVDVPAQFLLISPYVLTMLALAGFVGRSAAPAALGVPYDQAKR